jgi:hypothetical protein
VNGWRRSRSWPITSVGMSSFCRSLGWGAIRPVSSP